MYEEPTENTDNTAATEPPPTEPTENTSAWLTEPTEQTVYTQPTQATQSTQYTQPTQATQSTQYTQPTQATQSPQYTQPTQATQATQTPTKFTQPTVTDPTQPTAATDSSKQLGEASPQLNLRTATVKCGKIITLKVNNKGSKKVKYSSNNSSVAKVSSTGKVSALKKGFARITAKVGSEKLYFTIKVTTSPKLSKASVTIKKGKYKYVLITGKASTVNNVYTNTKKAKILSKNNETKLKVKALRKGSTTLKVKVNGVVLKLKVKIT
ncbi:MAG: Ig-like domain-containing protein [Ruminococcus sp.]|nr:Ig-like domain-containing protein [Ruminococcus sp.]